MSSLFSEKTLGKFKSIRKTFLWTAVCILIGELAVGAILILTASFNETIGKLMGTLALCAVVLFVGINNLIRIEKGNKTVQWLALMSFVSNLVWLVIAILLIWEVVPMVWKEEVWTTSYLGRGYYDTEVHMTVMTRIMLIALSVAAAGFWTSNVMAIRETVKPVKPLKITAVVCEVYCCAFSVVMAIGGYESEMFGDGRGYALFGLAGFAFCVTALAAWIISRTSKKGAGKIMTVEEAAAPSGTVNGGASAGVPRKTDEELRAEIEEQVRREMIEKEVRARMEAQAISQVAPSATKEETSTTVHEALGVNSESLAAGHEPKSVPDSIYPEVKKD